MFGGCGLLIPTGVVTSNGDAFFSSVSLLLPMTGANGSTVFTQQFSLWKNTLNSNCYTKIIF